MKKKILMAALPLLTVVLGSALYAGAQDFKAVNQTGKPIHHIYVSEASKSDWEEDVLGDSVLAPGQSVNVNFDSHTECSWDFKAVDANGKEYFLYGANLCQLEVINIK